MGPRPAGPRGNARTGWACDDADLAGGGGRCGRSGERGVDVEQVPLITAALCTHAFNHDGMLYIHALRSEILQGEQWPADTWCCATKQQPSVLAVRACLAHLHGKW